MTVASLQRQFRELHLKSVSVSTTRSSSLLLSDRKQNPQVQPSELLPEFLDVFNSHGQTARLSESPKAKQQFPERLQSFDQVDTRDASS
jgi:hypothetical protein